MCLCDIDWDPIKVIEVAVYPSHNVVWLVDVPVVLKSNAGGRTIEDNGRLFRIDFIGQNEVITIE